MRRLSGAMVALLATLLTTLLAPGAIAGTSGRGTSVGVAQRMPGGPVPLTDVPCPSIWVAGIGGSVLATVAPGTSIATSLLSAYGAVRYPGVPAIGLVPFAVPVRRVGAFMAALRAVPGVQSVALDRIAHAAATTRLRTPRDPLLRQQWALAQIHATQAWGVEVGTSNAITVAVLDTGVDATHPDLLGRVAQGVDFVDADTDASDVGYHGTAVASVIAADTDNRIGMAGLSWGAQILPVRVLGPDGTGTECTIAAGIVYAADQSWIENLSLGADGPCSVVMQEAVDYAGDNNTAVVAAVGNDAKKNNPPVEPADCTGAVGVGATDQHDRIASFSEHGPQVAVSAPGVHVLAAYRTNQGGHSYAYFDGTSLAAPMVSGIAALVFSRNPSWSAAQVIARIKATAIDLGKKGRDDYYGAGRVDAGRALTAR